jgi:tripartite-type tricarboxylate transporter receptor subunit TctC
MTSGMTSRRSTLRLVAAALACAATGSAHAQSYPTKPIKLIVPFGPGGPTDVAARLASRIIQDGLGQPVVIENRPGAGGATGTRSVAQSEPDGYTLLLGTVATLAAVPAVQSNPGFDPVKSFAPVSQLTASTALMIVPPSLPVSTVGEFIAYAKANPGKLNYSSAGVGNQTHLNGEVFKAKTGVDLVHVPYKSGAEMLTAVLTEQAQLTFSDISVALPLIEEKKLKALAVTTPERWPAIAHLPTMIEGGVPDFVSSFWTGVLAPAGTPADIVNKLSAAIHEGLKSQASQSVLSRIGALPRPRSPQELSDYIGSEAARWSAAVKLAGIKPE